MNDLTSKKSWKRGYGQGDPRYLGFEYDSQVMARFAAYKEGGQWFLKDYTLETTIPCKTFTECRQVAAEQIKLASLQVPEAYHVGDICLMSGNIEVEILFIDRDEGKCRVMKTRTISENEKYALKEDMVTNIEFRFLYKRNDPSEKEETA